MSPDSLSVLLRTAVFATALQALGGTCFLLVFRNHLAASRRRLQHVVLGAAIAAVALVLVHAVMEAARMTGEYAGALDPTLLALAFSGNNGVMIATRILGLLLLAAAIGAQRTLSVLGILLVASSFAFVGHTAVHPDRYLLAPLLGLHVAIAGFWVGSLTALYLASVGEAAARLAALVEEFSRWAIRLVPLIFVAGFLMSAVLLPDWQALRERYGLLLLTKVALFALLMWLAALNKWRLGPALAAPGGHAASRFRAALLAEGILIVAALAATAVLTSFYSPEP